MPAAAVETAAGPQVAVADPAAALAFDAGRWRLLPALASPLYRRFILGALVTNVGSWMQQTAQGWLVLGLTNSPALLGLTSAAANLPILLLSLHAGALADRIDLRRLLVVSRLTAAGLTAVLALLTTLGVVEFWHVVAVAFLVGATTAIASPAYQTIMSSLVSPRLLGSAIALNSAQFNLSRIVGPSIAGVAISVVGLAVAFWSNALSFVFSAATIASLPPPARTAPNRTISLWSNVIAGVRHVRRDPVVLALLLLPLAPGILNLNYIVLLPVFARDVLQVGAAGLGLMTAAVGVGAVIGALSVAVLRPGGGSGALVLTGLIASSLGLLVFSLSPWLPLSLVGLAVLGGFSTAYYTTTNTLLQLIVPGRMRGRVMSLYILTSTGFIPLGNILAGVVAEHVGAPATLAGMVLVTLAICAFVLLRVPQLLAARAGVRPAVDSVPHGGDG